jgi:hypothetical protein
MSTALPTHFDYTLLDPEARAAAREAVSKIKAHGRLAHESIVAIGAELAKAKAAIGHGHYLPWLSAEFGWSARQAQRFVAVYETFGKSDNVADLGALDVSALYLLAAPSTPEPVRETALEKAAAGERVTQKEVKALLELERDQAGPASDSQPDSLSEMAERFFSQDENVSTLMEAAPELGLKVKAGEMKAADAWREIAAREKELEEEEVDDTKFIVEHLANAFELVEYYKGWKPQEIARLIDPARRNGAMRKAKRLGNWLKDLGYWLERGP